MPTNHAFLSASASHRWLNCPPSAKLCESLPDQTSSFAQEGTDCHELCAYLVEKAIGKDVLYKMSRPNVQKGGADIFLDQLSFNVRY